MEVSWEERLVAYLSLYLDLELNAILATADHLWWSSAPGRASHPHPAAPRCLPCNYPDAYMDKMKAPFRSAASFKPQAPLLMSHVACADTSCAAVL